MKTIDTINTIDTANNPKPRLLTIPQAAKLIDGLSPYRLGIWVKEGKIPHVMCGNKPMLNERVVLERFDQITSGAE
jgi:hypothetical protein